MSEEEVLTSIIPYASVLAEYFRDNDGSDTIDQLRGRSLGAHGQQQTALDMEIIISDTYNSFTSPQLEEHREKTKKIWDDMTRAAFPQLESNIIDTVISILKENFGSETSGWWKKGVPEEIRKEIGQIRESDEEERDYEYYINLSHIPKIVTESGNWSELFKDLFGFPQYGKKKDEQVRWLDDLVKIKNAINSNKRITQDDYNEMNDLRILFEKKCSDANRLVEIHETIIE